MTTPKPRRWFGRTKLITVGSIALVVVAGAFAIGANVGILNAADDNKLGQLSAAGVAATPSTQVVDVYVDAPAVPAAAVATTAGDAAPAQYFTVDTAGTVAVVANNGTLRLDSVSPASGWSWSLSQTQPTRLILTLTNGTRRLEFVADLGPDGSVTADVNEPAAAPTATPSPSHDGAGHDEHEYEGGEDDD